MMPEAASRTVAAGDTATPTWNIVNEHVLRTRYGRCLRVEQKAVGERIEPAPQQLGFLQEQNRCWLE